MTPDELKRITLKVIKRPRQKPRLDLAENEWRFTLNIEPDKLRFNGIFVFYTNGVTVDWGDGTVGPASYYNQRLLHEYSEPGRYHVSVKGTIGIIECDTAAIVSLDSPIPKTMETASGYYTALEWLFCYTTNLIEVPEKLLVNCTAVTTAAHCFEGSSRLLMLPNDILAYCPDISNVDWFVSDCRNLKEIPQGLFSKCPKITGAEAAFRRTDITEIPSDLFANNPLLNNANSCFYGCSRLKAIPGNLFSHNPVLRSVYSLFAYCSSLEELPSGLFQNSPSVYSFQSMFQNCTALTEIPGDFLDGIVYDGVWTLRFNSMFQGCSALTGIPGALFQDIPDGSNFGQCFEGCSGITGAVPNLWETHPNSYGYRCFRGCTNASNYSSIPSSWR